MSITVALLTYNRASDYLAEAIQGVLSQTYRQFKILVLDNHSSDATAEYILGLYDDRITYVRHPPGKGPDYNFNSAIEMSNTKYILITHDDDIMEPTMLEEYVKAIQLQPDLLCVASNVSLLDGKSNIVQERLYGFNEDRCFEKGKYIQSFIDEVLWLPTPTQMFRRKEMIEIMNLKWSRKEKNSTTPSGDILMNCQLNALGSLCLLEKPLLRYRQHDNQISRYIDQSKPLLFVIDRLVCESDRYPVIRKYLVQLQSLYLRYKLQDVFFQYAGSSNRKKLSQKLGALKRYIVNNPASWMVSNPSSDLVKIAFHLLDEQVSDLKTISRRFLRPALQTPASIGFRLWLKRLCDGGSLFNSFGHKKIVIFGSMLLSYLIVLDAIRHGVEVVCCLDTSNARIGANVIGIPVLPLAEFSSLDADVSCIVMSNERSNETAIRRIIINSIGSSIEIYSWKELLA